MGMEDDALEEVDLLSLLFSSGQHQPAPQASAPGSVLGEGLQAPSDNALQRAWVGAWRTRS